MPKCKKLFGSSNRIPQLQGPSHMILNREATVTVDLNDPRIQALCSQINESVFYTGVSEDFLDSSLLKDVETDGRTHAEGTLKLFVSDWCRSFAHGADTVMHIHKLAERLLQDGESIVRVDRIRWNKPMTTNLRMSVIDSSSENVEINGEPVSEGEFVTSDGRLLKFKGIEVPSEPINSYQPATPLAGLIKSPYPTMTENEREYLVPRILCQEIPRSDFVSVYFDILTNAAAKSLREIVGQSSLALAASFESVDLPVSPDDLFDGSKSITCRFLFDQQKVGKTGMLIIPVEFDTDYGLVKAYLARTNNYDVHDEVLRRR
jgi:hypothetical protein